MDKTTSNQVQQNNAFLMQENDTQFAWLLNLDTNLTRAMGGVFPERNGDVTSENFCAIAFYFTCWGIKTA